MKLNLITRSIFYLVLTLMSRSLSAQTAENSFAQNLSMIQLNASGDQQGLPIYTIDGNTKLELNFDDFDGDYKSYYYTYVLCDYHWSPVPLSSFDYIKGFTQNRITTYRYSSIAYKKYTHYQALLPDQNCLPIKSGNYLLKVYLDSDTSKVVFTKKMLVVEPKSIISAAVVQPFTPEKFYSHQRLKFNVNIKDLNTFSAAQQVKVVILQNNRWDNSQRDIVPSFVRGNILEYNTENVGCFAGGKEWRWLDLRSFRLRNDRIEQNKYDKLQQEVFLKSDRSRVGERYAYFTDYNGMYNLTTYESINPLWQADYANVHFSFDNNGQSFIGKDIYLIGQFTGFQISDRWKMQFNSTKGEYECSALLKQGYYNYAYTLVDQKNKDLQESLEGDYWETENTYTILVYYKSIADRNDRLIGVCSVNSRKDKAGFGF